jgi:hypothetical protein
MPQEVFDQDRPPRRSAIAPPSPRRADALDIAPWMGGRERPIHRAAAARPESRAA